MAITFTGGNQAGTFALYCNGKASQLILGTNAALNILRRALKMLGIE
ncbi:hypothetical protein [Synechococcus sp. OH2]